MLRTGLHLNSCYVIYAIIIPFNINSRYVALKFLCFQAKLAEMLAQDHPKSHGMKDYAKYLELKKSANICPV